MISFDLTGKVAIVTGASQGLGKDMARGLAEAGADVVIMARRVDKLKEVAAEIHSSTGRKILPVYLDITKMEVMQEAVQTVLDMFGKIDILVNNAALIDYTPAVDLTEEAYDRVLDANVKGPFFMAKEVFLKSMKEKGGNSRCTHLLHIQSSRCNDDSVSGSSMGTVWRLCKCNCARADYAWHGRKLYTGARGKNECKSSPKASGNGR